MALDLLSHAWRYRLTIMVMLLAYATYSTARAVSDVLGSGPIIIFGLVVISCSYASYRVGISSRREMKLPAVLHETFTPTKSVKKSRKHLENELAIAEQRLAAERVINGSRPTQKTPEYAYEQ